MNEDFQTLQEYDSDPLIAGEVPPTMSLAALVHAHHRLKQAFGQLSPPLLILHGAGDKAPRPHGSQTLFDAAGATDKSLKLYDRHFYDLLNDVGRETVMVDILEGPAVAARQRPSAAGNTPATPPNNW